MQLIIRFKFNLISTKPKAKPRLGGACPICHKPVNDNHVCSILFKIG